MRATSLAPLIVIALGCEKQEPPPKPSPPPIAIRFGDCASANVTWISGPRPMAFTLAQAEGNWPSVEAAKPPPPPPNPPNPPAVGDHNPRIALLEDKNRKVLDRLIEKDLDLGKFSGLQLRAGPGTGVGVGTGTRRGGAGHGTGIRRDEPHPGGAGSDDVAFADLLTSDPPDPGSLAGGYWFGTGSPADSLASQIGEVTDRRLAVFRPRNAGLQSPERYTPGASNPFAAQAAALSDCLQRGSSRYGAFVVELAFDPSGAVKTATTSGLTDEAAKTCVTELAEAANRPPHVGPNERCSIAYGAMPIDVEHPLTLDGQTLTIDRRPIDFDHLQSTLDARVAAAKGGNAVLQLFGPIVLEPSDATPMSSVYRAIRAILDAGDDFVLARHAATWKLLVPLELPVVPVPLGSGGRWNRFEASQPPGMTPTARTAVIVTVKPQQITLAVGENQIKFWARDAMVRDKLAAALQALKASRDFSGRTDLELAGYDDATYGDLLILVDLATAAGFVDWQLTTPRSE